MLFISRLPFGIARDGQRVQPAGRFAQEPEQAVETVTDGSERLLTVCELIALSSTEPLAGPSSMRSGLLVRKHRSMQAYCFAGVRS